MSNLLSTGEKNSIETENAKPEVGSSGLAGSCETVVGKIPAIISRAPNYDNRGLQMSAPAQGFVKLSRHALSLVENDLDAFVLLTVIALRAHRDDATYSPHNLKENQAFIGKEDIKKFGLTEQRYRDTKTRIAQRHRLATFQGTNKGTIATLTSTAIYDINSESNNAQKNEQRTREGTEQERERNAPGTPNKNKEEEERRREKKTPSSKRKPTPSALASDLLKFFIDSLKKHLPSITIYPLEEDAFYFDVALEKYSPAEIQQVITFCHTDSFWSDKTFKPSQIVYGKNKDKNRFGQLQMAMKRNKSSGEKFNETNQRSPQETLDRLNRSKRPDTLVNSGIVGSANG